MTNWRPSAHYSSALLSDAATLSQTSPSLAGLVLVLRESLAHPTGGMMSQPFRTRSARALRARRAKLKRRLVEPLVDARVQRHCNVLDGSEVSSSGKTARGPTVPTFWFDDDTNVGDILTRPLLTALLGWPVHRVSGHFPGPRMLAVGSILSHAREGDVVWGSGLISDREVEGDGVRFLAVRGPLTRERIRGDVPEVYGDPAILLPSIYQARSDLPRKAVGVVPHYLDHDLVRVNDPQVRTIDVRTRSWRRFVDQIAACELVVSSSLHGIIIAEAYGIPAVWLRASDRLKGGNFKFNDYYAATDRDRQPVRWSGDLAGCLRDDLITHPPQFDQHLAEVLRQFGRAVAAEHGLAPPADTSHA